MSGVSTAQRQSILNSTFGTSTLYLALFSLLPVDSGLSGVELSNSNAGYSRIQMTTTDWEAAKSNGAGLPATKAWPKAGATGATQFNPCTAPWDSIDGWGILTDNLVYDPTKGTNLLAWGDLANSPIATITGSIIGFAAPNSQIIVQCGSLDDVFS